MCVCARVGVRSYGQARGPACGAGRRGLGGRLALARALAFCRARYFEAFFFHTIHFGWHANSSVRTHKPPPPLPTLPVCVRGFPTREKAAAAAAYRLAIALQYSALQFRSVWFGFQHSAMQCHVVQQFAMLASLLLGPTTRFGREPGFSWPHTHKAQYKTNAS